ncbi:uncharacterized protein LY89DRAFT_652580 [Mollisia scopiformis]|uniref:Uncharacterized protein n=1 Tax=Mollisia scopiformis TaxID=149040 RepID=A0A194WYT6_MOLSC|nr:uncharacterized protein LY89DRAFT_652580 [Mollisia scopiformis]KUJ13126.1 hypothetical protein LY89DRAFT_652580 [Mollisia scopiformis]
MSVPINNANGMLSDDIERNDHGLSVQRTGSLSMDPVMFEKLFLSPQTPVHGQLRQMFGVPTPLALIGFGISLTPLACCLMGWRGSDNQKMGAANIGAYFWFGGAAVLLAAIGEFLLGNTFAFTVFAGYGAWYLTYAATLQPFYGAAAAYAPVPGYYSNLGEATVSGQLTPGYTASFGFVIVFMTVLSLIFLVCASRVNIPFFLLLLAVTVAFALLSAALFIESQAIHLIGEAGTLEGAGDNAAAVISLAKGEAKLKITLRLVVGAGASFFAASMLNWFLTLAIMLAVVDFPFNVQVGDLSTVMHSRTQVERAKRAAAVQNGR